VAFFGGLIIGKLKLEKWIESMVFKYKSVRGRKLPGRHSMRGLKGKVEYG